MKLFIVTGSSGVGKSTVLPFLKQHLAVEFDAHDFDERLTQEVVESGNLIDTWRLQTTAYWIKFAEENAKSGKSTVVVGLIHPQEVTELNPSILCQFCLLDASDEKIRERLMGKRFSSPSKIAGLKHATGNTPEQFIAGNKLLMEGLRKEIESAQGEVIDTTADIPEQTADKIFCWVLKNS